ncbi:MAG: amidohydrolase [Bacteroidales bacterium]|nr:amidohydrolase [Bacteroidales bacterium]
MTTLKNQIRKLARKYFEEVVEIRRHIHQYPELSFHEYDTARYLESLLHKMGLESRRVAGTGLTGMLGMTDESKKTIALRADIDALPVFEKNKLDYSSKYEGRMHACGHDAHSAMLIGALKILRDMEGHLEGNIRYIFQPGEEKLPGGAWEMIRAGVLNNPKPDLIIGQHVYPELSTGQLGFKPGPYMASTDEIYLTIRGKGGHGAMPNQYDDTVYLATQIIQSLQQIVSRKTPPTIPTVLSFGKIIANGATNVIPDEVYMEGTFRTMDEKWRDKAHRLIREISRSIIRPTTAECDVHIKKGYPVLKNDEPSTNRAVEYSKQLLGKTRIHPLEVRMTAEDFAYYTREIPGIFYRLGIRNKSGGINNPLHSSSFNIDEKAMETGMANMAWLAISFLSE